jgi:hypothetical protein
MLKQVNCPGLPLRGPPIMTARVAFACGAGLTEATSKTCPTADLSATLNNAISATAAISRAREMTRPPAQNSNLEAWSLHGAPIGG